MEEVMNEAEQTEVAENQKSESFAKRFRRAFREEYDTPLGPEKSMAWPAFWITLLLAVIFFIPLIVKSEGIFTYFGDYNAQQIPFYRMAHDMVRSGQMGWNWYTDLGVNFIGSYSFYLLGSPFFWLTIPFPSACVPYLMAPLFCLKMACMSLTAYLFLHRFVRSEHAVIGGILYAFCGFATFNVFFNHFHEAMIWLPLMLYGLELRMTENKRGIFGVAVLLAALNNYYFFFGQVVFLLIYWLIRLWSKSWKVSGNKIAGLWIEAILGTAAAGILLLPSFFSVIQNSRVENYLSGWRVLIYSKEQRFWDILHSFFFPPDLPARPNFFPDADNKWASMSAWIPMFGCTGAIAYFQSRKHNDWLHRILIVLVVMAFIPFFNSMFQMFNSQYYARWFYMLILLMILATLKCLDVKPGDPKVNWPRAFGWSGGITAFFVIVLGCLPTSWKSSNPDYGLVKYSDRFWVYVAIVAIGLIFAGVCIWIRKSHEKLGLCLIGVFAALISLVYSWYIVGTGQAISSYQADFTVQRSVRGIDKVQLPDTDANFYRIDVNEGQDNQGIYWQIPCIQAFHSIVPESVTSFYESIGVHRGVASRPETSHYAIRSLTSVLWEFDYSNTEEPKHSKGSDKYFQSADGTTKMNGYTYATTTNGYYVYQNNNYIPMGFTYDSYMTRSAYNGMSNENRELAMLKALVVEDDQVGKVTQVLSRLEGSASYDYNAFVQDCANRRKETCSSFEVTKKGFNAGITLSKPNLVFFSVPYEENGWTATVNGQQVEIIRSNVGFMSVMCPAGFSEIEFTYKTPGLATGALITGVTIVIFAAYLFVAPRLPSPKELRKRLRKKKSVNTESNTAEG